MYLSTLLLSPGLRRLNVSVKTDTSGAAIGKRYARMDEIGTAPSLVVVSRVMGVFVGLPC